MQYANARLSGLVIHQSHRCIDMACNALEYIFAALLDAPLPGRPPERAAHPGDQGKDLRQGAGPAGLAQYRLSGSERVPEG